ncbi:MAG: DUF2975 domain-containing protein [Hyphomonadaceae bacterium]|nr:DUF2975 domain-containing protein [Clostridia bacterium]
MLKKSFVHYLTKVLVDIMFYVGILCCLAVPMLVNYVRVFFGYDDFVLIPLMIILFTSGVCALYILFNLQKIFKTLVGGNTFIAENVSCLRKMAVASFLIALIYIAKCTFWFTIATAIIIIMFVIAGLFCLTLKDVFKQAIAYKEESDFTV